MVDKRPGEYQDHRRLGMDKRKSAELELIGQKQWVLDVFGGSRKCETRLYTTCANWGERAAHHIGGIALHLRMEKAEGEQYLVLRNEEPKVGRSGTVTNHHGVKRIQNFIKNFGGDNPKHPAFHSLTVNLYAPASEHKALLENLGITEAMLSARARGKRATTFHTLGRDGMVAIDSPLAVAPVVDLPVEGIVEAAQQEHDPGWCRRLTARLPKSAGELFSVDELSSSRQPGRPSRSSGRSHSSRVTRTKGNQGPTLDL